MPPILNTSTASLLVLISRLVTALPRDLWAQVVPPAISDALAAVARDEVLCTALPKVRRHAEDGAAKAPLLHCHCLDSFMPAWKHCVP